MNSYRKVQAVEQTNKRWKLMQALGFLGMIVGLVAFFMSHTGPAHTNAGLLAVGCLPVWLLGRLGAWWFHA